MKIKNMKLMLLSLFGLISMNATAGDIGPAVGKTITRANLAFEVTKAAQDNGTAGEVTFLGMVASPDKTDADGAIANQPDGTITIPATVWTLYGDKGNKVNYNVKQIDANWASYGDGANVKAKLTKLVSEVVEKDKDGKETASHLIATGFAKLAEVVLPTGQTKLAASAFSGCTVLAKINLGNIKDFGANCLDKTIITSLDLTSAVTIGASAFEGINTVKTVSIPATVESIGADAFKDMYKASWTTTEKDADGDPITVTHPAQGLEELTFNACSDATKGFATIPAVFAGDALLKKVTVTSTKATGFAANAFNAAVDLQELDLSGCTALTDINTGDFAAAPFTSIKLAGTKIKNIANLDLTSANRTLATITLPTTFGKGITATAAFGIANKFQDFIALTELDLSNTQVKEIPASLFEMTPTTAAPYSRHAYDPYGPGGYAYDASSNPVYIDPVLATVKLNAETTAIGANAFDGCVALATVEGLNQAKMATIGAGAFNNTALAALDLSATKVTVINPFTFGNIATLTSINLPAGVTEIYPAAFANDGAVTSINLGELTKLTVLNPIFHEGVVDNSWAFGTYNGYPIGWTSNEVAIPLATVTLPANLKKINPGALQLLDIEEITIPAKVDEIQQYALQGCINLKKFTWDDAQDRWIYNNAFRGDDHMEEVRMVTATAGNAIIIGGATLTGDPVDLIFKGNSKDVLKFIVNTEDYASLVADGWTEANLKFCTLTTEGASVFEFKAASKTGEYYYATYYNANQATWFPAENFEVFSAIVQGSDVVLNAATTEGGYYKVKKAEPCIVRSKVQKADYELKNASFNDISTMPTDNELRVAPSDFTPSRLKYQYKFGVKGGVVAFYRVTSGTIKKNTLYVQSNTATDRLNIVFEDEATAIQGFKAEAESNAPIYNLNGVRVNKAGKGVYIQNGKKFVK